MSFLLSLIFIFFFGILSLIIVNPVKDIYLSLLLYEGYYEKDLHCRCQT